MESSSEYRFFEFLYRYIGGWRFPVMVLYILGFYSLLMISMLFVSTSSGAFGQFAESFKTWCFGYDPATGHIEMAYLVMMLVNPMMLASLVYVVWCKQIKEAWLMERRHVAYYGVASLLFISIIGSMMFFMGPVDIEGELPFPAEELRTAHISPSFTFTNQEGKLISMSDFEGDVVLLTGVYASCGNTCPMIMGQTKRAIEGLSETERRSIHVVGVTLDPERDKPEVLKAMAMGQQVSAPIFNLVTGNSVDVNKVLDQLNISRKRDPETGVIDHVNLFVLVDRTGKIAYRFSLGDRQEEWLIKAMKLLIAEPVPEEAA